MHYIKFVPITLAGLLFVSACSSEQAPEANTALAIKPVPVRVESIRTAMQSPTIRTSGMVASQEEVKLSFKIGGIVQRMLVKEGQFVKKGQLLARLESTEINAQVDQAQAALEKADRDLTRGQSLYEDTVATLEQIQDLTTAKEVAEATLKIAAYNQRYAEIYAPVSGRILNRMAEAGELVGPGNPVFILGATNGAPIIRVGLTDRDVVQVKMGDEAQVHFDAFPNRAFSGTVNQIAASANPQSGLFDLELVIDPQGAPIKNGFIGKVTLIPTAPDGMVNLPMRALVEADRNKLVVYTPDEALEHAERLEIQGYVLGDSFVSISRSELKGHTFLITDGVRYLKPDAPIEVIDDTEPIISQK